jgi:hypothetical protein
MAEASAALFYLAYIIQSKRSTYQNSSNIYFVIDHESRPLARLISTNNKDDETQRFASSSWSRWKENDTPEVALLCDFCDRLGGSRLHSVVHRQKGRDL